MLFEYLIFPDLESQIITEPSLLDVIIDSPKRQMNMEKMITQVIHDASHTNRRIMIS